MTKHATIILASTSPRRRELVSRIGIPFKIVSPNYEEDMTLSMSPKKIVGYLSRGKADSIAEKYKNSIIISGDTIVACEGKVLGKAKNVAEAKKILQHLSGKKQSILTGLTIIWPAKKKSFSVVVETTVTFKKLSNSVLDTYLTLDDWKGHAGAYALQGIGGSMFIKKIEGDIANAIGLPIGEVIKGLEQFGVPIFGITKKRYYI